MLVFGWLPPLGMLLYAAGSGLHWHWVVTDLGVCLFAIGLAVMFIAVQVSGLACRRSFTSPCSLNAPGLTQSYIVDTYSTLAVSALSASIIVRSLMGFAIPSEHTFAQHLFFELCCLQASTTVFAEKDYDALGLEKGGMVLAAAVAGAAVPLPFILFFGGHKLRGMSKHAWHKC